MPEHSHWLGIDYGRRTVGMAIGHPLTGSARPLAPIRYKSPDGLVEAVLRVIQEWRPGGVVIGLPLSLAGEETETSRAVRGFAAELGQRVPTLRLELHDERLSSSAADGAFAERRAQGRARKRDAERLDSMAAALILESWMSEHARS